MSQKLTSEKRRYHEDAEKVNAPHVIEINEAINGEFGPKMQKLACNYRQMRENIMKKLQEKSHAEYYQQKYGVPYKNQEIVANQAGSTEKHDLYSDLDEFNRQQTIKILKAQAYQYLNFNETIYDIFDENLKI